jgi:adenosylmethionine-8-amino-7-oxononanoate aminotransferase
MSDSSAADKQFVWHPFTQMADWCAAGHAPIVLVEGDGALLRDSEGRAYIDGNSSIWTNLHGHRHPRIDAAIRAQLDRVAHTSFLGLTHPSAARLAAELVALWPPDTLTRVFFSDDGSTAIEVALKMAARFWQLAGQPRRQRFVAFVGAYHGDTMGAASLGGLPLFHAHFASWHFPIERVANVAELARIDPATVAAVIIEPVIQGAAGMRIWPHGLLKNLRAWCDAHDVLLVADEVMTGFGRTGTMFACEHEQVVPDFFALAKGLSGGYLPLAARLTPSRVFIAFICGAERTLYYGHSYTANALACAAALANLEIFREERTLEMLKEKIAALTALLRPLSELRPVLEVRQCGFIAAIEVNGRGREVCLAARGHGLLTRPIGNVVVLMPPYCITHEQLATAVNALDAAIRETLGD